MVQQAQEVEEVEPTNEVKTDIELKIEEVPYIEMMKYAQMFSPNECSGTGLVRRQDYTDGSVRFTVEKVYLPNQNNTGATTDITDEEMAKVNCQVVMDGDDPELHKFHWHSHVDMSVFHSGTDDENYNEMGTGDYAISLVVNKKYDMLASVHLYSPLRIDVLNIAVDAPDLDLDAPDYEVPQWLQDKLDLQVEEVKAWELANPPAVPVTRYKGGAYGYDAYEEYYGGSTMNYYGEGLTKEPVLLALLKAGEQQDLITLFYDETDKDCVVGYMVNATHECFELGSTLDYTNYQKGGL